MQFLARIDFQNVLLKSGFLPHVHILLRMIVKFRALNIVLVKSTRTWYVLQLRVGTEGSDDLCHPIGHECIWLAGRCIVSFHHHFLYAVFKDRLPKS